MTVRNPAAEARRPGNRITDRVNKRVHDQGGYPVTQMDAHSWQEPIANEGTDQANHQITDEAKSPTFHHTTGKPPCDNADHKNALPRGAENEVPRAKFFD